MGSPTCFHNSQSFWTQTTISRVGKKSHLLSSYTLNEHFNSYFTDVDTDAWDWVRDPFIAHSSARGLSAKAEEELLELSCDGTQKIRFRQSSCVECWPLLRRTILNSLL